MTTSGAADLLPQLQGHPMVTDGGMETDLIFHHGVELPCFAAFPLVETEEGRTLLRSYYDEYAAIAERRGAGLLLETPTWRANADWGGRLGYDAADLVRVNAAAVDLVREARGRYVRVQDVVLSGMVGPRGDGYTADARLSPTAAYDYHHAQVDTLARAGSDLVTALTLTHPGEAVGIVRAARDAGVPVAVSFTVEVDGRLPDGRTLREAVAQVDDEAAPDYYLVNCAHPRHIVRALADDDGDPRWRERIVGLRPNASTLSHAELDEAEELDEGDPQLLAAAHAELVDLLPRLTVVGGCCGTDARHVAALWAVGDPAA